MGIAGGNRFAVRGTKLEGLKPLAPTATNEAAALSSNLHGRPLSEEVMMRTINQHHRAAKRLFALAEQCRTHERRLKLLQLARLNLWLAKAKLENPALRPDKRRSFLRQV
jgi:hypothetical protein